MIIQAVLREFFIKPDYGLYKIVRLFMYKWGLVRGIVPSHLREEKAMRYKKLNNAISGKTIVMGENICPYIS